MSLPIDEEWRPIPGWGGGYEVSSLGRVRGVTRVITRRDGYMQAIPGKLLKQYIDSQGRPVAQLREPGRTKQIRVHKLVLAAFRGPRPDGMQGCHNDGNRLNNRLDNLRWDTQSSNQQDAVAHGVHAMTARTHCTNGHPLAGDNLRMHTRDGAPRRRCRTCERDYSRQSKRKLRAAALDAVEGGRR